jgi:hypothetical protein
MLDKNFLVIYTNGEDEYEKEYPTFEEAQQAQKELTDMGYLVKKEIEEIRL